MMLKRMLLPATLLCSAASAQMPGGMSEQDMQKMMAALQEVQACFQQIDQNEVLALKQRSEAFADEVRALCQAGKRDQAQASAMDFYKQMMGNKTLKKAQSCAKKIPDSLKAMVQAPMDFSQFDRDRKDHVCGE